MILNGSADCKYLAPLLAVKLDAGYLSNVVEQPSSLEPFTVKRTSFSNKSFCDASIKSDKKIISLLNNSFEKTEKRDTSFYKIILVLLIVRNTSFRR